MTETSSKYPAGRDEEPTVRFQRLIDSAERFARSEERADAQMRQSKAESPGESFADRQRKRKIWTSITIAFARRMLMGGVTLVAIIFLTYLGLRMAQGVGFGDAAMRALKDTPEYLRMLAHGDLGMTGEYGFSRRPIEIIEILPLILSRSFGLLAAALFIATLFGIPLGFFSAARRGKIWRMPALLTSIIGVSAPSFFTALVLQLLVIRITQALGYTFLPVGGFGWDEHLILPALVLAARPFAQITRISYIAFSEVLEQEYVRTARSKGLPPSWIFTHHIWPNTLIPILTTLAIALRFSLISLPIVEFFFGWQGVGFYLLKAISTQEFAFAIGMLLSLSLAFILVNALLEVSYRFIDPRLREVNDVGASIEFDNVFEMLKRIPQSVIRSLKTLPLIERITPRDPDQAMPPLSGALELSMADQADHANRVNPVAGSSRLQILVHNPALIVGAALIMGLAVITLFGVQIAPQSPYTTRGLTITDGRFLVPPFPPDETFLLGTDLLGRDMLSLILAGAQQTFVIVALVVMGRILVGFLAGAVSGWLNGSWVDRFFMGCVEVLASFPALLLAMVLILALDIRRGLFPFFLALTFVGWGEIMQFVRAEVMRLKSMTFIESAIASGATIPRVLGRHIQPNLIPALISLTALEMGAVLMILGELGFVGIFIGGGIFAELEWMAPLFHYSDVPEWGALLGNLRTYARGYPWMAIYPSIAFFLAILAFNLFGEGLRNLIDRVGVRATRWINRYTMAGVVLAVFAMLTVKGATGALASYRKQVTAFNGIHAVAAIDALTAPAVEGRALGSTGMHVASGWIADRFAELELQPAGELFTYFQTRQRAYAILESTPALAFDLDMPALRFEEDFNVFPSDHSLAGSVYAPVTFLALGEVGSYERLGYRYYELEDLDYSEQILLVFPEDMFYVDQIPRAGTLVIALDENALQRQYTLSPYDAWGREAPTLWISTIVANRLLSGHGTSVSDLHEIYQDLGEDDTYELDLEIHAAMEVKSEPVENYPVQHVIGHWQGFVSNQFEGIDDELFIVLASYDCPPVGIQSEPILCANDNASGVAVMLESVRTMRAAEYQPYRTFLFVAYSGEGFEGGGRFKLESVNKFLDAKYGFDTAYDLLGVIELRGLGDGTGEQLIVTSDGSQRLTALFERAANDQGLKVERVGEDLDLRRIFETGSAIESGAKVPWITISREGWDKTSHTRLDQVESIDEAYFEAVGQAVTQTLMVLGRELDY